MIKLALGNDNRNDYCECETYTCCPVNFASCIFDKATNQPGKCRVGDAIVKSDLRLFVALILAKLLVLMRFQTERRKLRHCSLKRLRFCLIQEMRRLILVLSFLSPELFDRCAIDPRMAD